LADGSSPVITPAKKGRPSKKDPTTPKKRKLAESEEEDDVKHAKDVKKGIKDGGS